MPAKVPHEYGADADHPWSIYWIHFGGSLAKYYAAERYEPLDIKPTINSRINSRISLFDEIFQTLNSSFTIDSIRYAMVSFHHFLATLRYIQQYRYAGGNKDLSDAVQMTIHYFEENINHHLTLEAICNFVGLSTSRLSALFKEKIGYSPLNYFMLLKIKRACSFLDNSDMKVHQISASLGFEDPYYFSRIFSKVMGMSPKAYRIRPKS